MKTIKGNLLDFPEGITTIFQNANCRETMGAGIAKQIKERYPEVYVTDCEFPLKGEDRLGEFSMASVSSDRHIINLYAQDLGGRNLSEEGTPFRMEHYLNALDGALYECIEVKRSFRPDLPESKFGFPWKIGSGLSGGNWDDIKIETEKIVSFYNCEALWVKYEPEVHPKHRLDEMESARKYASLRHMTIEQFKAQCPEEVLVDGK